MNARTLALVVLLAGVTAGCSFDRRTGAFRCDNGEPCGDGRVCENGWCVLANQPGGDGGDGSGNNDASGIDGAFVCPQSCTRCEGDLCVIDCNTGGACATEVVCPAGIRCKVECGASACVAGIDCSAAQSCRIECTGQDACAGPITCSPGFCRLECGGSNSCVGGIDCSDSCACETLCTGSGACTPPPTCPTGCTSGQGECIINGQCNQC